MRAILTKGRGVLGIGVISSIAWAAIFVCRIGAAFAAASVAVARKAELGEPVRHPQP